MIGGIKPGNGRTVAEVVADPANLVDIAAAVRLFEQAERSDDINESFRAFSAGVELVRLVNARELARQAQAPAPRRLQPAELLAPDVPIPAWFRRTGGPEL